MTKWEYTEQELWRFNENGDAIFHVFGLVSVGATVLAFAEARQGDGSDDQCSHDIRMRKSIDGGRTFAPDRTVISAEKVRCWANPVPVYDAEIGRLFLFYGENIGGTHTGAYLIHSDDLGETWSAPRDMESIFENAGLPAFRLAGPGHGIQVKCGAAAGRLIVPVWYRGSSRYVSPAERGYCVSALYSDDHGATWHSTQTVGKATFSNESRIVETKAGLLWHMRTVKGVPTCISRSEDGGMTWSEPHTSGLSVVRNCDVGAVSLSGKDGYGDMVLLSRCSDPGKRLDMEILISLDGGETFTDTFKLMAGDVMPGYSDLCVIYEDAPVVGLLHCRNNHVLFSRISLQTLTGGKYENTSRNCWLQ